MKAVISVSDKTGVVELARGLAKLGFEVYSTGGTHKALAEAGVAVSSISELTGFPEILDGRVKTLPSGGARRHPRPPRPAVAHGGAGRSGIETIDLVAVNLYPFVQTVTRQDVSLEEALENIDIGGPTMIRAAAKNFPRRHGPGRPCRLPAGAGATTLGSGATGRTTPPGAQGLPACGLLRYGHRAVPAGRR